MSNGFYKGVRDFQDIQLSQRAAVNATGTTDGGIQIQGRVLKMTGGSVLQIPNLAEKTAGNLSVTTSDLVEIAGESSDSSVATLLGTNVLQKTTGNGGDLSINTSRLIVRDGAQVFSGTEGKGAAGSLQIKARDSVELTGAIETLTGRRLGSSISTLVVPQATGSGGNITLETQRLTVSDGAVVSTATLGKGRAGNLTIEVGDLVKLSGTSANLRSSLSSRSISAAPAGNLTIETKHLEMQNGAQINVRNSGSGKAGVVQINASSVGLNNGSSILASATSGEGGNIFLNSQNLQLRNGSSISATAGLEGGGGNGGNITINTDTLTALSNSSITANAFTGRGGNIQITTKGLFRSPDSIFNASSQFGINGLVKIETSEFNFIEVVLPEQQLQNPQVAIVCQGQAGVASGELIDAGTGGTPTSPSDPLDSSSGWHDLNSYSQEVGQLASSKPTSIVEAQGWKRNNNGTVSFTTETDDIVPYGSLSSPACIRTQSR